MVLLGLSHISVCPLYLIILSIPKTMPPTDNPHHASYTSRTTPFQTRSSATVFLPCNCVTGAFFSQTGLPLTPIRSTRQITLRLNISRAVPQAKLTLCRLSSMCQCMAHEKLAAACKLPGASHSKQYLSSHSHCCKGPGNPSLGPTCMSEAQS